MNFVLQDASDHPETTLHVDWQETNCLLCNGRNWFTLVEAPDRAPGSRGLWFAVVQCNDCGLCFTNPRPTLETIHQFYPEDYKPHRSPNKPSSPGSRRLTSFIGTSRAECVDIPFQGRRRLLDFGCGSGAYLQRMHERGWNVLGIDVSQRAVETVRTTLRLPALLGSLPHPELKPNSFEVISMQQSLEHVHYPLDVVREAHRLLVPGGKLFVSVPNIDSLPFRWFGHAWSALDLPRHLTHFAPWTLRLMLERVGFKVGNVHMIRHSSWFRTSAMNAYASGGSTVHRCMTTKLLSRLAGLYSYWTSQCDCMLAVAEKYP